MRIRSGRGKVVASALTTAALAISLLVPGSVLASTTPGDGVGTFGLSIDRDCGTAGAALGSDAQGQCSFIVADPSADQDASAKADNKNLTGALQLNLQGQANIVKPEAEVTNTAIVGSIKPEADLTVRSGSVDVYGHTAYVDFSRAQQNADAGASGFVIVSNETGDVSNTSRGDNWAISNAGAANSSSSGLYGFADTSANGATLGGNGGDDTGNVAGYGPYADGFGVAGGFGGSNVNLGLGASLAAGGDAGPATSTASQSILPYLFSLGSARNGEAESGALAAGGFARSGYGAQADPTQTAGNGGDAGFSIDGRGGDASGTNYAYGGAGTLTNTSNVSGTTTANGTATGGTSGAAGAGNSQVGNTGQNDTTVHMTGGLAVNTLNAAVTQSGDVTGYSGQVSNSGSVNVPVNVNFNQGSTATATGTNTPNQSASNSATSTQTATSGAQTASPTQSVSTGRQDGLNVGVQDALKSIDSFNRDYGFQGNAGKR